MPSKASIQSLLATISSIRLANSKDGLLSNDLDPNQDTITVQLTQAPKNGNLNLFADGSFQYRPSTGFVGTDSFRYRVSDGQFESQPSVVTIDVTRKIDAADFDRNGVIDTYDIDLLTNAIAAGVDLRFDLTSDGILDAADRVYMIEVQLGTVVGDSNLDGAFDSSDLVYIFQQRKFEDHSAVAGWPGFATRRLVSAWIIGGFFVAAVPAISHR